MSSVLTPASKTTNDIRPAQAEGPRLPWVLDERPAAAGPAALVLCALSGALLGLSCPGIGQSYLAWFCLAPLLLAVSASEGKRQAFVRATVFGAAYNLVYIHWVLFTQARAFAWTGMSTNLPAVMAVVSWLLFSGQQAFLIGIFASLARALPISAGILPQKIDGRLHWPTMIVVPLLWVLAVNRIGNGTWCLGIPWSMLEYSQYKEKALLALCPYIGGIGLEALIVMANVAVACLIATCWRRAPLQSPAYKASLGQLACATALIVAGAYLLPQLNVAAPHVVRQNAQERTQAQVLTQNTQSQVAGKTVKVSVVQANIGTDETNARTIVGKHVRLACQAPKGLCVWTEWSFPCYLSSQPEVYKNVAGQARANGQDWLVGTMDKDELGQMYNAVCALNRQGVVDKQVYYKRFLVPFGEYIPPLFKNSVLNGLLSGDDDEDFYPGKEATVMHLQSAAVAPIICFESLSPTLVIESVKAGGQIITDLSDTKWFGDCAVADQMMATCVIRAAECGRSIVYAANTGPSALIAPDGQIKQLSPRGKTALLTGDLPLRSDITPFCRWYR